MSQIDFIIFLALLFWHAIIFIIWYVIVFSQIVGYFYTIYRSRSIWYNELLTGNLYATINIYLIWSKISIRKRNIAISSPCIRL